MNVLVPRPGARSKAFPALLQRAGKAACWAADEFFAAQISNPHTRRAYARPVGRFLTWCEAQGIELCQVTPGLAGRFIEDLPGSDPTRNLALVTRHAVALNPFASVRGRQDARADDSASAGVAWLPGPVKRRGAAGSGAAGGADLHRSPRGSPGAAAARGSPEPGNAAGLAVCRKGRQAARAARSGRVDRRLPGSGRHRPVPQSRAPVFGGGKGGVGANGSTDDGARGAADAQATAQGVASDGLLRVSEVAALDVGDVQAEADGSGRLFVGASKTDQEGRGAVLYLGALTVSRVNAWLAAAGHQDGPLFRRVRRGGRCRHRGPGIRSQSPSWWRAGGGHRRCRATMHGASWQHGAPSLASATVADKAGGSTTPPSSPPKGGRSGGE